MVEVAEDALGKGLIRVDGELVPPSRWRVKSWPAPCLLNILFAIDDEIHETNPESFPIEAEVNIRIYGELLLPALRALVKKRTGDESLEPPSGKETGEAI